MFLLPVDDEIELRLTVDAHAQALFRLTDIERAHLRRWLPWVDSTRTVADTRAYIAGTLAELAAGRGYYATVFLRGTPVGALGLRVDRAQRAGEVGYWLSERAQGAGVMTRSVRALTGAALGELGLHRVVVRAATGNTRSRAVPERLGFHHEGTLRDAERLGDRFVDLEVYAHVAGRPLHG